MSKELIINARPQETRVALVENRILVELHTERKTGQELLGNIYVGKVTRVLPGMQAAFVDIGVERTAFLYVSDVHRDTLNIEESIFGEGIPGHRAGDDVPTRNSRRNEYAVEKIPRKISLRPCIGIGFVIERFRKPCHRITKNIVHGFE